MKFKVFLLSMIALVSISGLSFGMLEAKAASNERSVQSLIKVNIRDYTVRVPTNSSTYQLTYHEPGMTYVTSNNSISVTSTGRLITYFSTTANVYVYRDGVLDHPITVIVGRG